MRVRTTVAAGVLAATASFSLAGVALADDGDCYEVKAVACESHGAYWSDNDEISKEWIDKHATTKQWSEETAKYWTDWAEKKVEEHKGYEEHKEYKDYRTDGTDGTDIVEGKDGADGKDGYGADGQDGHHAKDTGPVSKDYGSGSVSKDYGSGSVSKDYGSGQVSKDYGSGSVSKDYGSGQVRDYDSGSAPIGGVETGAGGTADQRAELLLPLSLAGGVALAGGALVLARRRPAGQAD
jgi:hypothetical protein